MSTIKLEYVWIGGKNIHDNCPFTLRSKTKVIHNFNWINGETPNQLPIWNYDGSSTEQAETNNSEVLIVPKRIFRDPFRKGIHRIVLCDTYLPKKDTNGNLIPHPTNTRYNSNASRLVILPYLFKCFNILIV